jgi:mRNA interferase RelE/StbE
MQDTIADLAKIDRTNQIRIAHKIKWLGKNFEQITPLSLSGNLSSFFKLRVGDYRVIYCDRAITKKCHYPSDLTS